MINKYKNICDFYSITNKLKETIRTGWKVWEVKSDRLESVAEHIYGTQMLAFVVNSEFGLGLDIQRVAFMLAFHELGETIVGDIPVVDILDKKITKEEKHNLEFKAVQKILSPLENSVLINDIFNEFENTESKEALFAHRIDKLEASFQCKYYEEKGCNDFSYERKGIFEKLRQERLAKGMTTMAEGWIDYDKEHSNFDELFTSICDYISQKDVFNLK